MSTPSSSPLIIAVSGPAALRAQFRRKFFAVVEKGPRFRRYDAKPADLAGIPRQYRDLEASHFSFCFRWFVYVESDQAIKGGTERGLIASVRLASPQSIDRELARVERRIASRTKLARGRGKLIVHRRVLKGFGLPRREDLRKRTVAHREVLKKPLDLDLTGTAAALPPAKKTKITQPKKKLATAKAKAIKTKTPKAKATPNPGPAQKRRPAETAAKRPAAGRRKSKRQPGAGQSVLGGTPDAPLLPGDFTIKLLKDSAPDFAAPPVEPPAGAGPAVAPPAPRRRPAPPRPPGTRPANEAPPPDEVPPADEPSPADEQPPPPRVVNATLYEGRSPEQKRKPEPGPAIQRPLRSGEPCELAIQIGLREAGSQVKNPPVIDEDLPPLPPEKTGWNLEVVVFCGTFQFAARRTTNRVFRPDNRTAHTQALFLPRSGESKRLLFTLQAPREESVAESKKSGARLRFGLYHKNHLLQSYVLTAEVRTSPLARPTIPRIEDGDGSEPRPGAPVITCDFSQSGSFENLDRLPPRALSLGLNNNSSTGTHHLFIKGSELGAAVELSEIAMKTNTERFRAALRAVGAVGNQPRFGDNPSDDSKPYFESAIRDLAKIGHDMYLGLFRDRTEIVAKILEGSGPPVQISRYSPDHAYPWPIVYDFHLPDDVVGNPAPVCLGTVDGVNCGCTRRGATKYCLNGFWGIRLDLEQTLGLRPKAPVPVAGNNPPANPPAPAAPYSATLEVVATPPAPSAALITDEPGSAASQLLLARFGARFAALGQACASTSELCDALWQPARRPGLLVAFGHLAEKTLLGEPEGVRFGWAANSPAGRAWLQPRHLQQRVPEDGRWTAPASLVFLLMCDGGAAELGKVDDFVQAFVGAGAGGVLGAETYIFRPQATLLLERLLAHLTAGCTMGTALRRYWRERTQVGDPLCFSFSYIGPADLTLA